MSNVSDVGAGRGGGLINADAARAALAWPPPDRTAFKVIRRPGGGQAALPTAERQQVGILDKRLLQPLAEAVGIEAGPPRLDNNIKVKRQRPGRSDRALVFGQMVDSVQNGSPCITANGIKAGPCGCPASV